MNRSQARTAGRNAWVTKLPAGTGFSAGILMLVLVLVGPSLTLGQPPGTRPPTAQPPANRPPVVNPAPPAARPPAQPAARPPATPGQKKPERPAPRVVNLVTADGINLRTLYFPSDKGREAVPVILVHEWQGQASPYAGLVKVLWDSGCAVVVPELRGHGGSKEQEIAGRKRELDVGRMGKADVMSMITADLETVKKFLVEENNARRLNLNALTLVGIREGAIIASHWAVRDLNFPSVGSLKQGQDVKAMVLISPEKIVKGLTLEDTLSDRAFFQLPFQIIVGANSRQASETERFQKKLEGMKKRVSRGEARDLQFVSLPTSLDGASLVNDVPTVIDKVKTFIDTTMIANAGRIPWVARE